MIHNKNISKNKKSSINLEELLERIKDFEKKYGKYEEKNGYGGHYGIQQRNNEKRNRGEHLNT